jgi:hypothetical protein
LPLPHDPSSFLSASLTSGFSRRPSAALTSPNAAFPLSFFRAICRFFPTVQPVA